MKHLFFISLLLISFQVNAQIIHSDDNGLYAGIFPIIARTTVNDTIDTGNPYAIQRIYAVTIFDTTYSLLDSAVIKFYWYASFYSGIGEFQWISTPNISGYVTIGIKHLDTYFYQLFNAYHDIFIEAQNQALANSHVTINYLY